MRPKVVILTLAAAFVILGIVILLKGILKEPSGDGGSATADSGSDVSAQAGPADPAGNNVALSAQKPQDAEAAEQARAAEVEQQLEQINALQGESDGNNNATIIPSLLAKMMHQEGEVRSAALDALRYLDDTNAVPGLQQFMETIKDPREKVAVMDTIEYLKLPGVFDESPGSVNSVNATVRDAAARAKGQNVKGNPNLRQPKARASKVAPPAGSQTAPNGQPQ